VSAATAYTQRAPHLAGELQSGAHDGADEEVGALGRTVRRLDESRDESDHGEKEEQGPLRARPVDDGRTEGDAHPGGHGHAQEPRSAHLPLVQAVLADRPQRADGEDDGVEALVDHDADQ
jgi:hypothetical protein